MDKNETEQIALIQVEQDRPKPAKPVKPPKPPKPPKPEPEPEPEPFDRPWQDVVDDLDLAFTTVRGAKYVWGGKDFKALKRMALELRGNSAALVSRWLNALRSTHPVIGEVWQMQARLNQFAEKGEIEAQGQSEACSVCGEPAACLTWGQWLCRPHREAWDETWQPGAHGDWSPYGGEPGVRRWVADVKKDLPVDQ